MSDSLSVSIFMGSKSDLPIVQAASDTLKDFGISHKMFILMNILTWKICYCNIYIP